jgi:hypothetical protein
MAAAIGALCRWAWTERDVPMRTAYAAMFAVAMTTSIFAAMSWAADAPNPDNASPIYGVTIPDGYRQWQLVGVAQEAPPLDELRAVVGNPVAVKAYADGTLPFPDGTVLVKLAWKHTQSTEFVPASVPGAATTVQVMVKDSKRYACLSRLRERSETRSGSG